MWLHNLTRFSVLNVIDSQLCVLYLLSFALAMNDSLNGTLPSEVGNLKNLKELVLCKWFDLVFHQCFWSLFVCCDVGKWIESILIPTVRMKTKHVRYNTHTYAFLSCLYVLLVDTI